MAFRGSSQNSAPRPPKSPPPPDETHQEANYLKMLGEQQHPVIVKMRDGSTARGWIEYYDRRMVRLTREGAPNLFIYKHEIAYIAEDSAHPPGAGNLPGVKNGNSKSAR